MANTNSGLVILQTLQDLMQYSKREFSKKWEIKKVTLAITQLGLQAHDRLRLSVWSKKKVKRYIMSLSLFFLFIQKSYTQNFNLKLHNEKSTNLRKAFCCAKSPFPPSPVHLHLLRVSHTHKVSFQRASW